MRRRGRGQGNIFGGSEPEDALPEFDEFVHMKGPRVRRARYRVVRDTPPRTYTRKALTLPPAVRPWVLGLRIAICSILLVLGLIGMTAALSQGISGYVDAGRMASAPTCRVDPTTTSDDCVGTRDLVSPEGTFEDGTEDEIALMPPSGNPDDYDWVDYPGNAQFDAAFGDGTTPTVVRAEFWKGQVVTITAGSQGFTVTTDQNPNNLGGVGIGGTLMSFTLVLFALLLFVGIRAIRLRWLPPGIVLRLFVSESIVVSIGTFIAGVCLVNQPGRVVLVAAIAPPITLAVMGFVGLAVWSGSRRQVRLVRTVR